MKKRFTYEYVCDYFKQQGCELLETEYINNHTKMKYICKCGNISSIQFRAFKSGQRCKTKCLEFNFNSIKNSFKKEQYELLEKEYKGIYQKLKYRCSKGHVNYIMYNNFRQGRRCRRCWRKSITGKKSKKWISNRKEVKLRKQIRQACYNIMFRVLKKTGKEKNDHAYTLLGYTPCELRSHLQRFDNWEIIKEGEWHVDHIFPIRAFLDYGIFDLKIINSLKNLQPLSGKENRQKHGKYNKEDFENWLKNNYIQYAINLHGICR